MKTVLNPHLVNKARHRIWSLFGNLFFWYLWDNQKYSGKIWGRRGL